jgi:cytochrome b6-f complex iron-sulfur subunit
MQASPAEGAFVPDMPRRQAMNSLLVGAVGVSTLGLAVPYLAFFVPAGKFILIYFISF